MIDLQLFTGVLVALAALAGLTIVLVAALYGAASVTKPDQQPPGGKRRDLPQLPQPDADRTRELVLR